MAWLCPHPSGAKNETNLSDEDILKRVIELSDKAYVEKIEGINLEAWRGFERNVMLNSLDQRWREHLAALDHLRQGIHLRGYAQKNPKQEYKREAFELFEALLGSVRTEVTRLLLTVQIRSEEQVETAAEVHPGVDNVQYHHADYEEALASAATGDADKGQADRETSWGVWDETIPAPVARARNTSTATALWPDSPCLKPGSMRAVKKRSNRKVLRFFVGFETLAAPAFGVSTDSFVA